MKSRVKSRPLGPSAYGCVSHTPLLAVTLSPKGCVPVLHPALQVL